MSSAVAPPPSPEVPPVPIPLWRRPAILRLLVIALLAEIGYAVLNISTMPVYLAAPSGPAGRFIPEGRDLGPSVIGFVLVAFLLSEAVFKSPMGTLADRIGHRKLMLIGPSITACTSVLTLLIPLHSGAFEVAGLILLRIADGVGAAMLWPAAFALMGSLVEESEQQQSMSLLNLCYMLGIALALPIGGVVNDLTGHKYASLFLACLLFSAVALAVFALVPSEVKPPHSVGSHGEGEPTGHESVGIGDFVRSLHEIPSYLILAVVTFAGIGFPMAVIKLFATDEFHLSETLFGTLVFPAAISMAAFSVPLSKYGESMGKARAVHVGLSLCFVGLAFICLGAFIPLFRGAWCLAIGGLPLGIGFLLTIPAWMASVSDIDPRRRGANIGAVMTAQGIGAIIGAPIGSTLYEKLTPAFGAHVAHYAPFMGCALCLLFGWLLSLRLLK